MGDKLKFVIPGKLPGLNEYIEAERGTCGKYRAATMKKIAEHLVCSVIKTQLPGAHCKNPVILHYMWIEPNRRRDKDNIVFAKKFIHDALVKTGVIDNDGWKNIENFTNSFGIDAKNPRIEVVIEEVKSLGTN